MSTRLLHTPHSVTPDQQLGHKRVIELTDTPGEFEESPLYLRESASPNARTSLAGTAAMNRCSTSDRYHSAQKGFTNKRLASKFPPIVTVHISPNWDFSLGPGQTGEVLYRLVVQFLYGQAGSPMTAILNIGEGGPFVDQVGSCQSRRRNR